MLLTELLNDDQEEAERNDSNTVMERYISALHARFKGLSGRDKLEQDYQDWKYLNFQEYELVSEWNLQSKDGAVGVEKKALQEEWEEYESYRAHRMEYLDAYWEEQRKQDLISDLEIQKEIEKELERELELEEAAAKQEASEASADRAAEANSATASSGADATSAAVPAGVLPTAAENSANPQLPRVEVEEDEDEPVFFEEDDDDDEYEDRQSQAMKRNKNITLHSDKNKIVKELLKMYNKARTRKSKKRRFTSCTVIEYDPMRNSNLNVKITLKQYHVRQLKRIYNEIKRQKEAQERQAESENSSPKKKRKTDKTDETTTNENDNEELKLDQQTSNPELLKHPKSTTIEGIPTYGMQMNTKEARAIQRHYENTYISIWRDLARKDSAKTVRLVQQIQSIRSANFKKISSLCAREARKWQSRNFKQSKDFQGRARRGIREMSTFWKRNEREERDLKKKAEKEALESAKKEEEERESKRQAKKLNFLLTQTELYSHFIGRKIKTNEFENNDDSSNNPVANGIASNTSEFGNIDLDATIPTKSDIKSIDFDNEDDELLRIKAAQNASSALAASRAQTKLFDQGSGVPPDEEDDEELNFQNPTSLGDITIEQPLLLTCTLKEYQLKGLNWLANLYDQGINGILADEMGLGKTVQSISVLAHLAEKQNIWGPFLIVTPASTLHNWVNEITKFVPQFKILPYWGNGNDRKILRRFWDRKSLRYTKSSPFHVMITSYQMVVSDAAYLQKMRWQYMILDEAQAIKSSQSSRWKNLLSFNCRNRLLLTGTPIQNNMQELWALLHFIMPSLFDSHDEFNEWFSRDIESHAEANTRLNQQQLRRLHMILKPFMLRRVKKNVQSELGDKIEVDLLCDLTQRQAKLYQVLKSQVSANYDAIENAASVSNDDPSNNNTQTTTTSDQSLLNAVMQFRKVCNHPDLFERADVKSPFAFVTFGKTSSMSFMTAQNNSNAKQDDKIIDLHYSTVNPITYHLPRLIYEEMLLPNYENNVGFVNHLMHNTGSILNPVINRELCSLLALLSGIPAHEYIEIYQENVIQRALHTSSNLPKTDYTPLIQVIDSVPTSMKDIKERYYDSQYFNTLHPGFIPNSVATPITVDIPGSSHSSSLITTQLFEPKLSQALSDIPAKTQHEMYVKKKIPIDQFPKSGMYPEPFNRFSSSHISMPSMDRFITDSAKLRKLDQLLPELKADGHRVLIYFQMTKMMDLMEEYLTYRQYNHIRLDGSSKLEDRRDLVNDWQTKPEIFVFLLSTRAGGLGINLTAADTVIFYDSDWNPTIDSQAMDRAHRLGQTRQVTVYRLLVRGTIEERMRDRAKQKEQVQQVVMEGKTQTKNTILAENHIRPLDARNVIPSPAESIS